MTIDKFFNKWYNKEIEDWGSEISPEYKNFQTNYRSVIKELCQDIDMKLYSFDKNHYNFSAVIKSNKINQFYYMSIPDVRYWKNEWANKILYRTMEHEKDWTGGSNHHSTLKELAENLIELDLQMERKIENNNTRQIINQVEVETDKTDDLDISYT